MLAYKLNNILLSDFNIVVQKCTGMFDMPARIGEVSYDWQDIDGEEAFTQTSDLFYKQRKITLDCVIDASKGMNDFQYKLGWLKEVLNTKCTLETPYGTFDVILKEGFKVRFINSQLNETPFAKTTLVFNQLNYTIAQPPQPNPDIVNQVYWIDQIDLRTFGIVVEYSEGHFDLPEMKRDNTTKYNREGDIVTNRDGRTIDLKCSLIASNLTDFATKISQFQYILSQPGLRNLMIPVDGMEKPLEVYNSEGFKISQFIIGDNQVVGSFLLRLIEPSPQIETMFLVVLTDTNGAPILTTNGDYIYVIGDRKTFELPVLYLYLDEEDEADSYIFTDEEQEEDVYLYTDEEINEINL